MTNALAWPDRDLYRVAVHNAPTCFDDPIFQQADFERAANGMPAAWNGARSIVFCARTTDRGAFAVRFALSEDPVAAQRYAALADHQLRAPLPCFVKADWVMHGVRLNGRGYPLLVMDWVEGRTLDRVAEQAVASATSREQFAHLAREWRETARSLAAAGIGHGDIHAGNILVDKDERGLPRIRLIDYDNISLPGLALPSEEAGHPAFQHPRRRPGTAGCHLDALGSTLTYLSLTALAADPDGWQHHGNGDDALLFTADDLADTSRGVWLWLADSRHAEVRVRSALAARWLDGDPDQYRGLEEFLAAADNAGAAGLPAPAVANVWPPRPVATPPPPGVWTPRNATLVAGPVAQHWPPPVAAGRPPAGPPPAPSAPAPSPTPDNSGFGRGLWIFIAIIVVLFVIGYAQSH